MACEMFLFLKAQLFPMLFSVNKRPAGLFKQRGRVYEGLLFLYEKNRLLNKNAHNFKLEKGLEKGDCDLLLALIAAL